jgi:hypothetical protein
VILVVGNTQRDNRARHEKGNYHQAALNDQLNFSPTIFNMLKYFE